MRRDFGRGDYKGWELIPSWGRGPAFKLSWAATRTFPDGTLEYRGAFESRAAVEAWVDEREARRD